jgi:hypothetical protein
MDGGATANGRAGLRQSSAVSSAKVGKGMSCQYQDPLKTSQQMKTPLFTRRGGFQPIDQNALGSVLVMAEMDATCSAIKAELSANRWIRDVYGKVINVTGKSYYPFAFKRNKWVSVNFDCARMIYETLNVWLSPSQRS